MERFGPEMFFSDPPVNKVRVRLCYRHNVSLLTVSLESTIKEDSPLTISSLIEIGRAEEGRLSHVCYKPTRKCELNGGSCLEARIYDSLKTVMASYTKKNGGIFVLDVEQSWVELQDAVAPNAEEWETMWEMFDEEEERRKSTDPGEYEAQMKRLLGRGA